MADAYFQPQHNATPFQFQAGFNPQRFTLLETLDQGTRDGVLACWVDTYPQGGYGLHIRRVWRNPMGQWGPSRAGATLRLNEAPAKIQAVIRVLQQFTGQQ